MGHYACRIRAAAEGFGGTGEGVVVGGVGGGGGELPKGVQGLSPGI